MRRDAWNAYYSLDAAFESRWTGAEIANRRTADAVGFPFAVAQGGTNGFCAALDINRIVLAAGDVVLSSAIGASASVDADARSIIDHAGAIERGKDGRSAEDERVEEKLVHISG